MTKILLIMFIFITSGFSLDFSSDTSKTTNNGKDRSYTEKEAQDFKNSESKKESTSESKDKTESKAKDLTRIGQVQILKKLKELEKIGVEPFAKCSVLSNPKPLIYFGIGSQMNEFTINSTKSSIIESMAKNSQPIINVGADERKLKSYIKCISYYGAVIAQSLKTNTLDTEIEDEEILEILEEFTEDIKTNKCRFDKSLEIIQCGSTNIKIDNQPILSYSNIPLFKESVFFGYSLSNKDSVSFSEKLSQDISRSKESSKSQTKSVDYARSSKESTNEEKSSKTSMSAGKFLDFK